MKFKTKRAFLSNFIVALISVFVPCVFFCVLVSYLWMQQEQKESFANDEMMLSLASQTFDTVLRDTTLAIGLMEADESLTASLSGSSQGMRDMPIAQFFALESAWMDTVRIIMAKPYISSVYFFLERYPDFVFDENGIRSINSVPDMRWLEEYYRQDRSIHLWAQPMEVREEPLIRAGRTIWLYRRMPYLHWDDSLKGVVAIRLEEAYFDALFDSLPQNAVRNIFILDDKFTQLYSLHEDSYTHYLQDGDIAFGESVNFTRDTDRGKMLISVVNSSAFNWSYISVLPLATLSDQFAGMRRFVFLFILLAFLISLCLAAFITHRNYRPIRTMVQMIHTYRTKGVIESVDTYSHDEYGYVIYHLVQTLLARQEAEKQLAIEQILQKESSLLALQSQINPHFLYNTLEVVNWEAIDLLGPGNNISQMLLCLSSNLRYITQKNGRLVALREELDHLTKYITLQKLFTEDRVLFSFRVDGALLERKVPKLMLQPLVENAILHGFASDAHGVVRVRIHGRRGGISVSVLDSGRGLAPEALADVRRMLEGDELPQHKSLGLKNINSRLKLLYGEEFGLHIRSRLGRGTCVSIFIPGE